MARTFRTRPWLFIVSAVLAVATVGFPSLVVAEVKDASGLYVPDPNPGAHDQIVDLHRNGQHADAKRIETLIETPQAVWFTKGTPQDVGRSVAATIKRAKHALPVLVAYNIPGRDCANLSAGGATTTAEYVAWIDAFAAGIGSAEAIVILEPDSLGLLPSNCGAGFPFTDTQRFIELNHAVDVLAALPNARVYLDATHSAWLNVGDITSRLVQAGVSRADGFYLNASNYQFSANLVQYGTWISSCIALGPGADCPNQYWNGGPLPSLLAQLYGEWNGGALSNYGEWSDPGFDRVVNEAIAIDDPAARSERTAEAQRIANEQLPWLPLFTSPMSLFLGERITGVHPSIAFLYSPWAAEIGAR